MLFGLNNGHAEMDLFKHLQLTLRVRWKYHPRSLTLSADNCLQIANNSPQTIVWNLQTTVCNLQTTPQWSLVCQGERGWLPASQQLRCAGGSSSRWWCSLILQSVGKCQGWSKTSPSGRNQHHESRKRGLLTCKNTVCLYVLELSAQRTTPYEEVWGLGCRASH